MSQKEIKSQLINLYLYLKIRKADDIENITKKDIQNEKISSDILPTKEVINYIKNAIETLIELYACEKYEEKVLNDESKKNYHNNENKNDENGLLLYEGMLRKAEKNIRKYIRVNIYNLIFIILVRARIKIKIRRS